jgi:LysR family transcriptional regulator, hydrogen peroxide-inducible genes activator
MELRQLRYLCAVVDQGGFTAAAKHCAVAQPSLSQQIMNLEQELGQPLLVRHPRKVELTEAGAQVLRRARLMLSEMHALRSDMEKRSGLVEGVVELGVIPTVAPYLLPPKIRDFQRAHPGVRIQVRERRTSRVIEELVAGRLDFAIISDITTAERQRWSLHVRELFHERMLLAMPKSHALALKRGPLALDQIPKREVITLSDGHCLGDQMLSVCRIRRGADRLECEQLETLLSLVGAGLGIGIVPEMAAALHQGHDDTVVIREFKAPQPTRVINLVRRRAASLSPAAEALLSFFV